MCLLRGRFRGLASVLTGFVVTASVLDLVLWTHTGHHETKSNDNTLTLYRQFLEQCTTYTQCLEVVLTFPYMLDPNWNGSGYDYLSSSQKEARMDEYITSLNRTLIHPNVKVVHLLYDQDNFPDYISAKFGDYIYKYKLSFHQISDPRQAISTFKFAFESLQDRLVMVTQADVYPEKGFDLIQYHRLKSDRLMYALTRHGKLERSCDMSGDFCDDARPFVGSHDSYIFVPQGSLLNSAVRLLSTDTMAWGVDLVITWVFQNELKYKVLNPCKVIIIYHMHCTYIRNTNRRRVNKENTTGWIPPSKDLY